MLSHPAVIIFHVRDLTFCSLHKNTLYFLFKSRIAWVIWQYFHISKIFFLFNPCLLCFWHFVKRSTGYFFFLLYLYSCHGNRNGYYISDIYMNVMSSGQALRNIWHNKLSFECSIFYITIAHVFRFVFFIFVGFYIKFVRYNIAYIHR